MTKFAKWFDEWKLAILAVPFALLLALSCKAFVAEAYVIVGNSMEPTLHEGDAVVIIKITDVDLDDLIVFDREGRDLIKRVVGMPGDEVTYLGQKLLLKPNEYFVMGDNREISHDSRHFGPIRLEDIKGEVIFK